MKVGAPCVASVQLSVGACSAQCCNVEGGSGSMQPQENFENLDRMRGLLMPPETAVTT